MIEKGELERSKNDPSYHKKPKMTHEQFLDDPFQKKKIEMEDFYAK